MSDSLIAAALARTLQTKLKLAVSRLKASLVAQTGDRLIEQSDALLKSRRNIYWASGLVYVLLLAEFDTSAAEIAFFAKVSIPFYPLLIGAVCYLILAIVQFRHENWRQIPKNSQGSEGIEDARIFSRALQKFEDHVAKMIDSLTTWRGAVDSSSMFRSGREASLGMRERSGQLSRSKGWDIAQYHDHAGDDADRGLPHVKYLEEQEKFIEELLDTLEWMETTPDPKLIEDAKRVSEESVKQLKRQMSEVRVRSDEFFALSSDIKFQERAYHLFFERFLPFGFAVSAALFALNDFAVALGLELTSVPNPWCPVCPSTDAK